MGMLLNGATGERIVLRANHVFGRNALRSDTHLTDPEVSLMHAAVRWRDGRWIIADHSRNGTLVNGRLLAKGHWEPLRLGQELRFGPGARSAWLVADLAAPGTSLVPIDPVQVPIQLGRNNLLPHPDAPELAIYQAEAGSWMLESQGEARVLADGETLSLAGCVYRFLVADEVDDTMGATSSLVSEPPHLSFKLSLDEEHTQLQVRHGSHHADLGERIHHYCLVTLARRRLADAKSGLDPAAQGWLGSAELAKMLGMDVQHLNIQIFRARNQLMSALPAVAQLANIVERRRGGLRLGPFAFEVVRGSQSEGCYRAAPDHSTSPERRAPSE